MLQTDNTGKSKARKKATRGERLCQILAAKNRRRKVAKVLERLATEEINCLYFAVVHRMSAGAIARYLVISLARARAALEGAVVALRPYVDDAAIQEFWRQGPDTPLVIGRSGGIGQSSEGRSFRGGRAGARTQ